MSENKMAHLNTIFFLKKDLKRIEADNFFVLSIMTIIFTYLMRSKSDKVMNKHWGRCELLRTIATVVTAICLLLLTLGTMVAGTWVIRRVDIIETTYHPERIAVLLDNAEKTMGLATDTAVRVHNATFKLKSGHPVNMLEDVHRLIVTLEDISKTLRNLPVEHVVSESELWRQMGTNLVESVKKTVKEL